MAKLSVKGNWKIEIEKKLVPPSLFPKKINNKLRFHFSYQYL